MALVIPRTKKQGHTWTGRPVGRPPTAGADLHIYITPEQDRWLRQMAHDMRTNRSIIMRAILEDLMKTGKAEL